MKYNLATLYRRKRPNTRRRIIPLRPIELPAMLASDLYAKAYRPIIDVWRTGADMVLDQYKRTLAEITGDSPEQATATISAVEAISATALVTVQLQLEEWAARVERFHRGRWRGAVLSATSVDIGELVGAGDMRMPLSAAIERNVGLIKSVSDETRQRIGDAVFRGFQQRVPAEQTAEEFKHFIGMSERRALNIAADQTVKIGAALNDERRREAGMSTWQWHHSGKPHYRPEHKARNGKRYDDDAKSGEHKPPLDRPGQLPFCGCTSRAILDLESEF